MANPKAYSVGAAGSSAGVINLYTHIGMDESGIHVDQFARDLQKLGNVRELRINISSPGGEVHQGFAMYNLLLRHSARKIVTIDGIAASMASVIAMAGDVIAMPENSMLMIHEPWGGVSGGADQIESFGESLSVMRDSIAAAYSKRSGLTMETVRALMARESWFSAAEAVRLGLADKVIEPSEMVATFDLQKFAFKNAPRSMFGASSTSGRKPKTLAEIDAAAVFRKYNSAAKQPKPEPRTEDAES